VCIEWECWRSATYLVEFDLRAGAVTNYCPNTSNSPSMTRSEPRQMISQTNGIVMSVCA